MTCFDCRNRRKFVSRAYRWWQWRRWLSSFRVCYTHFIRRRELWSLIGRAIVAIVGSMGTTLILALVVAVIAFAVGAKP